MTTRVVVDLPEGLLEHIEDLAGMESRTSINSQIVAMLEQYSPPFTGVEAAAERIIEAAESGTDT